MNERVFLDTNIFVYTFDNDESEKQKKAQELIEETARNDTIVISTQVLREFYVVVTQKLEKPLAAADAERALLHLMRLHTMYEDVDMLIGAVHISQRYAFSLWDSLIIQAALSSDCQKLMTEDMQHGFTIESLEIVNPFK